MSVAVSRAAIRAARSAAALSLDMTAAAAGIPPDVAARQLRALKGRGVCAHTAATAAASLRAVWYRRVVLGHWACPPPARRAAGGDRATAATQAAAAHPATAASRARAMASRALTHSEMLETMNDPACSPAVLRVFAANDPGVGLVDRQRFEAAQAAVSHSAAPVDLLSRAAHSSGLRYAAAQHPRCPPRVLRVLAQRSALSTRRPAAANTACPPEVLAELATDPDLRTRASAIANPSLPAVALAAVCDPAADIDDAVLAASNPNSGPGLARRLAASNVDAVAGAAASIPSCPTDVLESLAARPALMEAVVAHAACPVDLLVSATSSRSAPIVVRAAAANLGCPPEALRVAARKEDDSCRRAAAANPNCPGDVLGELLHDAAPRVGQTAAANPNCPSSALSVAVRLGPGDITNVAVAALRSRMRAWPGAAPRPDV